MDTRKNYSRKRVRILHIPTSETIILDTKARHKKIILKETCSYNYCVIGRIHRERKCKDCIWNNKLPKILAEYELEWL